MAGEIWNAIENFQKKAAEAQRQRQAKPSAARRATEASAKKQIPPYPQLQNEFRQNFIWECNNGALKDLLELFNVIADMPNDSAAAFNARFKAKGIEVKTKELDRLYGKGWSVISNTSLGADYAGRMEDYVTFSNPNAAVKFIPVKRSKLIALGVEGIKNESMDEQIFRDTAMASASFDKVIDAVLSAGMNFTTFEQLKGLAVYRRANKRLIAKYGQGADMTKAAFKNYGGDIAGGIGHGLFVEFPETMIKGAVNPAAIPALVAAIGTQEGRGAITGEFLEVMGGNDTFGKCAYVTLNAATIATMALGVAHGIKGAKSVKLGIKKLPGKPEVYTLIPEIPDYKVFTITKEETLGILRRKAAVKLSIYELNPDGTIKNTARKTMRIAPEKPAPLKTARALAKASGKIQPSPKQIPASPKILTLAELREAGRKVRTRGTTTLSSKTAEITARIKNTVIDMADVAADMLTGRDRLRLAAETVGGSGKIGSPKSRGAAKQAKPIRESVLQSSGENGADGSSPGRCITNLSEIPEPFKTYAEGKRNQYTFKPDIINELLKIKEPHSFELMNKSLAVKGSNGRLLKLFNPEGVLIIDGDAVQGVCFIDFSHNNECLAIKGSNGKLITLFDKLGQLIIDGDTIYSRNSYKQLLTDNNLQEASAGNKPAFIDTVSGQAISEVEALARIQTSELLKNPILKLSDAQILELSKKFAENGFGITEVTTDGNKVILKMFDLREGHIFKTRFYSTSTNAYEFLKRNLDAETVERGVSSIQIIEPDTSAGKTSSPESPARESAPHSGGEKGAEVTSKDIKANYIRSEMSKLPEPYKSSPHVEHELRNIKDSYTLSINKDFLEVRFPNGKLRKLITDKGLVLIDADNIYSSPSFVNMRDAVGLREEVIKGNHSFIDTVTGNAVPEVEALARMRTGELLKSPVFEPKLSDMEIKTMSKKLAKEGLNLAEIDLTPSGDEIKKFNIRVITYNFSTGEAQSITCGGMEKISIDRLYYNLTANWGE